MNLQTELSLIQREELRAEALRRATRLRQDAFDAAWSASAVAARQAWRSAARYASSLARHRQLRGIEG